MLAITPDTLEQATIRPGKDAVAMLFVIVVGTFESPTIRPREDALTMHLVVLPLTFVSTAIRPCVDPFTFDHIMKFANIVRAVRPLEVATSFLLAHLVLSFIGNFEKGLVTFLKHRSQIYAGKNFFLIVNIDRNCGFEAEKPFLPKFGE